MALVNSFFMCWSNYELARAFGQNLQDEQSPLAPYAVGDSETMGSRLRGAIRDGGSGTQFRRVFVAFSIFGTLNTELIGEILHEEKRIQNRKTCAKIAGLANAGSTENPPNAVPNAVCDISCSLFYSIAKTFIQKC